MNEKLTALNKQIALIHMYHNAIEDYYSNCPQFESLDVAIVHDFNHPYWDLTTKEVKALDLPMLVPMDVTMYPEDTFVF